MYVGDLSQCAQATRDLSSLGFSGICTIACRAQDVNTAGDDLERAKAHIGSSWTALENLSLNNGGSDDMLSLLCSTLRLSLRKLTIKQCRSISIRCVADNISGLTGLRSLAAAGCGPEVDHDDAVALVRSLLSHTDSMTSLDIGSGFGQGNAWVTDELLSELSKLSFLQELSLAGCKNFSAGNGLKLMCSQCSLLRSLDISKCEQITERDLLGCLATCTRLETLSVSYCTQLGDGLVIELCSAELCASLRWLSVYGLLGCISDESLANLVVAKGVRVVGRVMYSVEKISRMLSEMQQCANGDEPGNATSKLQHMKQRIGGRDSNGVDAHPSDGNDADMQDTDAVEAADAYVRSLLN